MGLGELRPQQQSWLLLPSTLLLQQVSGLHSLTGEAPAQNVGEQYFAIIFWAKCQKTEWKILDMLKLWVLISQFGDWVRIPTEVNPWPKIRSMQRWIHTLDTLELPHFQKTVVPTPQQYNTKSTDCPQGEGSARDIDEWHDKDRAGGFGWVQELSAKSFTQSVMPQLPPLRIILQEQQQNSQAAEKIFTAKTKDQTEQEYAQLSLLNSLQNFSRGLHKSLSLRDY